MSAQLILKCAFGYNGSQVQYISPSEVVWVCGNALIFQKIGSRTQRVLHGTSFGIQCFAVCKQLGLVAVAEKGPQPVVHVYRAADFNLLTTLSPLVSLGFSALAFSVDGQRLAVCIDEPDMTLNIYLWQQERLLIQTTLIAPVQHISFQPYNSDQLCTSGNGHLHVWRIDKLSNRYDITSHDADMHGINPTCHAWFPKGLYIGGSGGELLAIDPETLQPLQDPSSVKKQEDSAAQQHDHHVGNGDLLLELCSEEQVTISMNETHPAGNSSQLSKEETISSDLTHHEMDSSNAEGVEEGQTSRLLDGLKLIQATSSGAPVAAMVVSRDHVIVAGDGAIIRWFSHARLGYVRQQGHQPLIQKAEFSDGGFSAPLGLDLGGDQFNQVVLGGADGSIKIVELDSSSARVHEHQGGPLVEAHAGDVTGMAPHPGREGAVLSCGVDGTVRVWNLVSSPGLPPQCRCESRRTFSSAQTAIATSQKYPVAAIGSETGVLRLVSLSETSTRALQVTFRCRLHTSSIRCIIFSPCGKWVATTGDDKHIYLTLLKDHGASAVVIGSVSSQETITSLVWPSAPIGEESVLALLVSGGLLSVSVPNGLSAGGGRPSQHSDMHLSGREGVATKALKLEAPMLRAIGRGGDTKLGDLIGLGGDLMVHRLVIPDDYQAWTGIKGKAHKSDHRLGVHTAHEGALSCTRNGRLIASASADGHVATLTTNFEGELELIQVTSSRVHDVTTGGASAVSFDLSGRWMASAGAGGGMFLYETQGHAHVTLEPLHLAVPKLSPIDQDAFDEPNEMTEAEAHKKRLSEIPPPVAVQMADTGVISARLEELRQQLSAVIAANDTSDEIEKMDRTELIVDRGMVAELKAAADARVEALKDGIRKEHLHLEVIAERVRNACWESVDGQRGQFVTSIKGTGVEVYNFPLLNYNASTLRKVLTLRRMEVVEEKLTKQEMNALGGIAHQEEAETAPTPMGSSVPPVRGGGNAFTSPEDERFATGVETDGLEDVGTLMHDDMNLHGTLRKSAQLHFYRHQVLELKRQFNKDFEAVVKLKKIETDKILDFNGKMDETARDLLQLGAPPPSDERFIPTFPEDMKHVLTVRDEEVEAQRVMSDAERVKQGSRQGLEGAGGVIDSGLADRALKFMMGGNLTSKHVAQDPFALDRPAWMDGNPKLFSEEQIKEVREFLAAEKLMQEEKTKKVAALELELRSFKGNVEDCLQRFEEALQGLLAKRLKTQADVAALESRIIALCINLERCDATGDSVERELYQQTSALTDVRGRIVIDLSERKGALAELETRLAEMTVEDKQMDRNFKKEFVDAELFYTKLLHLYRWRSARGDEVPSGNTVAPTPSGISRVISRQLSRQTSARSVTTSTGNQPQAQATGLMTPVTQSVLQKREEMIRELAPTTMDPFPQLTSSESYLDTESGPDEVEILPDSMYPEGLDLEWWNKLVQYRAKKTRSEAEIRHQAHSAALLMKEVVKMGFDEAAIAAKVEVKMAAISSLRKERQEAIHDTDLQLYLKAGLVEAEPPTVVSSDMSSAVYIHRSLVEGLNQEVHMRGDKKVEIMKAIKDFKKGIYQLEWEHKRCDMMVEDLREKTKELQMLHVTRDLQSIFRDGEDRSAINELASLEALAKQREILHAKNLSDRQKKMRRVGKSIEEKKKQNNEVGQHMVTLESVLAEQERLRGSMQTTEDQNSRRMRSMVTHKRLKEIATAQQAEMSLLAAELDKLRLRTYPTFMDPNALAAALPPDTKSSLWK
ncbi:hypothetical protein CEUSTIGMA_g5196.t1 [Chlamydomonas eustigma]|uniref:Cilia- and flagella-associated protein 43 n=1 Tax=Chlamydomonas eustigma TaxID=1157962 RepID=A0A250X3U9_9CHLO|nr:hypothetical protein CEUSTIGMA_g5196.t1 [Chlamydomonas eustigma]|eukprot:GAX77753.1 hypothetical protein CEUSTIGMA_g5196.t1 [Chlamydomonas eustigma]